MLRFFELLASYIMELYSVLDNVEVAIGLSLADFYIIGILFLMILGVFWKGAKA